MPSPEALAVMEQTMHSKIQELKEEDIEEEEEEKEKEQQSSAYVVETPPPPLIPVYVRQCILWGQCCCFASWSLLAMGLLVTYVVRYFNPMGDDMHCLVADSALLKLEAGASAALAPAFAVVRTVALGARAGLFNTTDPVASLALTIVPDMAASPAVRHVQVVGATNDNLALLRPGLLHSDEADQAPEPLVYSLPAAACKGKDPMACFGLNTSGLTLAAAHGDAASVGWLGPEYLRVGPQGEQLGADEWVLALHLVGLAGPSGTANQSVAINVAIDLSAVAEAAVSSAPASGAAYVCTDGGVLVAGSDWQPVPTADPLTGRLVHPHLWDLPGASLSELKPGMVAAPERFEHWHGDSRDLVVVQPLLSRGGRSGSGAVAAGGSLRAVVLLPRDAGVRPIFGQLAFAAIGVVAAPVVVGLIVLLAYAVVRLVTCCCCRPRTSEYYSSEEEPPSPDAISAVPSNT